MKKITTDEKETTFRQQLAQLPEPLIKRFWGQMGAAAAIVVFTAVLLIYYKRWEFITGWLISLYMAYMALDVVWKYNAGKIVCRTMICLKAQQLLRQGRVFVIMQDETVKERTTENTMQFYISTSKKNAALITPQTVMKVYYNEKNPYELTAWEIIGNNGIN